MCIRDRVCFENSNPLWAQRLFDEYKRSTFTADYYYQHNNTYVSFNRAIPTLGRNVSNFSFPPLLLGSNSSAQNRSSPKKHRYPNGGRLGMGRCRISWWHRQHSQPRPTRQRKRRTNSVLRLPSLQSCPSRFTHRPIPSTPVSYTHLTLPTKA